MKLRILPTIKILLFFLFTHSIFADTFQNINGFFGERAAGMGGSFSAISDDVSGTFYNPAGIAFAQNSYYSINASSYNQTKIDHKNLFGPGQNYSRNSRNYLPNFIGFIKKEGKLTYGFSVLNPINQSFDQSDRITLPLYRRNLSQLDISYAEENFRLLAGPSVSYLLTDKLSIGLTTYYMYDSNRTIVNGNENQFNNNVTSVIEQNRRRTSGIIPILGIQYMLTEKLSLGLSLRKIYVTGGNVSYRTNVTTAGRTGGPSSIIIQSTENGGAAANVNNLVILSPSSYQIPQVMEVRGGWAYFISRTITLSSDLIYTSGYRANITNSSYDNRTGILGLSSPYVNELRRNQTLNYSVGFEFFLFDNFVFRFGHFTNKSNNEEIHWREAAWFSIYRNNSFASANITIADKVTYALPEKRNQYINLTGYTFGIGIENSRNSFSLTFLIQNGKGIGTIDRNQLPTTSIYSENTVFLSGSTRY